MQRFQEILVLVSADPDAQQMIARAAELAERNRARLTLFDVVPQLDERNRVVESPGSTIDLQQLLIDARRAELEEMAARVMTVETRVAVEAGVRFIVTINRVVEYHHDLLITAPDRPSEGRGLRGATNTLHLLRKCPVPVWVDDPATWGRRDVVVAIGPFDSGGQIDPLNRTLMELGTSLARIQGGVAHVVHAWRFEGEQLLRRGRGRVRPSVIDALVDAERIENEKAFTLLVDEFEQTGATLRGHLHHGRAEDVIGQVVADVKPGVVVMGTLARAGLAGLIIGNTAERIMGDLDASVIAVKPPGFVSPVTAS